MAPILLSSNGPSLKQHQQRRFQLVGLNGALRVFKLDHVSGQDKAHTAADYDIGVQFLGSVNQVDR